MYTYIYKYLISYIYYTYAYMRASSLRPCENVFPLLGYHPFAVRYLRAVITI